MSYRTAEFKNLDNEFATAAEPILNKTNKSLEALLNLLDAYNAIVVYAEIDFDTKKKKTKEHIKNVIEVNRITLQRCYEALNLSLTLPGALLSTIHYVPQKNPTESKRTNESQTDEIPTSIQFTQTEQIVSTVDSTQTEQIPITVNFSQTEPILGATVSTQTVQRNKSKMEAPDFLKLCGSQINKEYSGDPLMLKSFIKQIELLKTVGGAANLSLLKSFVHTKIVGKALECVREDPNTVDEIIEDLKKFIKPPNSKVVESEIKALKFNTNKAKEFTDQANKLAEALQRTLIIEGISKEKALEMTVDRTVDLCRQCAKTDKIDTMLSSNKFETPQDVLAKFVVETSREKTDKQILAFRQQNNRPNLSNNFQNRNTYGQRGRSNFNRYRSRNFNNSNHQNPSQGNFRQNYQNNRNNQSNQRGRGSFRNQYQNYNNNGGNERYVRMVAENCHSPSEGRADVNAQPNQPTILRFAHSNQ